MNSSKQKLIESIVRKAILDCFALDGTPLPVGNHVTLFHSPHAQAIKEEIVRTGKKLWARQYVDGNGGNISARISPEHVICTPTLYSKGDLTVEDLCLVDLNNQQLCGDLPQTSEIRLHLEIYRLVPQAKAVIHCHPPYATAHAIAGIVPQGNLVPEQEVFVGPVALTPYETPGTSEFARTIAPVVKQHNTILLANHGVVCWADTVTHAEWYVEVVDTYCKTVMIAAQLRSPLTEIPFDKVQDLLRLKQRLGLPDVRLPIEPAAERLDMAAFANSSCKAASAEGSTSKPASGEVEQLTAKLTSEIMSYLENHT